MLLSIQGGSNLGLFEINEAARLVQEAAHPEANIIFGAVIDDTLGDEVRVTVIAAGFDGGGPVRRADDRALGQIAGSHGAPAGARAAAAPAYQQPQQPVRSAPPVQSQPAPAPRCRPSRCRATRRSSSRRPSRSRRRRPSRPGSRSRSPGRRARVTFDDDDDLDVPDFLK